MANLLWNVGAAIRGQQEYEDLLQQKELLRNQVETSKFKLSEIKDLAEQAKKQRDRTPEVYKGVLDFLGGGDQSADNVQGIPMPPPVQAPPPGAQSMPMMQPGPPQGMPQGGPPMSGPPMDDGSMPQGPQGIPAPPQGPQGPPQGGPPPMGPGGPEMPPQGPQGAPGGQPPIPPYRTMAGAGGPPQGGAMGIPPPPMQGPRPGSMSVQDAARFIKSRGVTDPVTGMQILEQLNPYLTSEAKQEAAMLKMQLMAKEKADALEEKKREADMVSKDKNRSIEEQRDAKRESNAIARELGLLRVDVARQNANTRAKGDGGGAAGAGPDGANPAVEAMAWDYLIRGHNPPAKGGAYQATMNRVAAIAKENGLSTQELVSASADVKAKLAAKKNFEVRAQNMERAENQIMSEIPLIRDAIKTINLPSIPIFAKGGIAALRQIGDPRITQLDQAVETVFNEFEGIRTGNPGALNVSDVANAHKAYENAKTPQQMEAAIQGMERTMKNAKAAMAKTRKSIMEDVNAGFKKEGMGEKEAPSSAKSSGSLVFSNAAELQAAIKSGKIKKGQTFNDPAGNPHVVN